MLPHYGRSPVIGGVYRGSDENVISWFTRTVSVARSNVNFPRTSRIPGLTDIADIVQRTRTFTLRRGRDLKFKNTSFCSVQTNSFSAAATPVYIDRSGYRHCERSARSLLISITATRRFVGILYLPSTPTLMRSSKIGYCPIANNYS